MKKLICLALVLLMMTVCAAAEGLTFEAYSSALPEAEWESAGTERLHVAEFEEFTVAVCLDGDAVAALTVEFPAESDGAAALDALRAAGWLDEAALTALASGEADAEQPYGVLYGERRTCYYACAFETLDGMLWVSAHGGDRLHDSMRCSGMDVARLVTAEAGAELGFADCGTCRAEREETE